MRPFHWVFLFVILLAGCDRSLKQRAEEIREYSEREDRMFTAQALTQIKRRYWTVKDHSWYGKMQDGTIVRLNNPHVLLEPLPSREFYRGWHLQMTISSTDWRIYPDGPHAAGFAAVYAITRRSPTSWDIRVTNTESPTAPLKHVDGVMVEGGE